MNILEEIHKIEDINKLNEIREFVNDRIKYHAKRSFFPGCFVSADLGNKGIHQAVITKINPKAIHIALLGEANYLPRQCRNWRVSPTFLKILPDDQKELAQKIYDKINKSLIRF